MEYYQSLLKAGVAAFFLAITPAAADGVVPGSLQDRSDRLVAASPDGAYRHQCVDHICTVEAVAPGTDVTMYLSSGKEGAEASYRTDAPVLALVQAAANEQSLNESLTLVSRYALQAYGQEAVQLVIAALGGMSSAPDHKFTQQIVPGTVLHLTAADGGLIYAFMPN